MSFFGGGRSSQPATPSQQTQFVREAPGIEERKIELMDIARQVAQQPINLPAIQTAGLGALEQQGMTAAGQTGVGAPTVQTGINQVTSAAAPIGSAQINQFLNPYQQYVTDEIARQSGIMSNQIAANAVGAGAFGGGREGVQQAQFMNQGAMSRAQLQAQLLNQGFQQAQQAAGTDLAARQGLGQYQQALGQADQGFAQAGLDAQTLAQREALYEPFTRLGLVGQQLAAINPGAFGSTTVGYQSGAAPASPMSSFLGGGAGAGGVLGKLGIFG